MVDPRGVEPLSENLFIQLSTRVVCVCDFPDSTARRQAVSSGSPFVPDRFKGERPMQVHHSFDATAGSWSSPR